MEVTYPGCPATVSDAEARGLSLRAPRWGLGSAIATIVGAVAFGAAVGAVLVTLSAPLYLLVIGGTLAPWLILAGWPLWVTTRRGNGPRVDLGLRFTWSDIGWGLVAGLAGLSSAAVMALITQAIFGEVGSVAGDVAQDLRESGPLWALIVFAALIAVGAPIVEEIAFRGLLFNSLRKKGLGPIATIAITAVAFAVIHLEPLRLLILLPIGIAYGWVRWKTGSLGSAIVAHTANNFPVVLVLLIGVPEVTP